MKNLRSVLALLALLIAAPAAAQQVQIHSVPIGKGGGVSGFNAAVPGASGMPLVSQGAAADPAFGTIGNSGLTPGAADTYKGSLNGSTVADVALPSCTAVNSALRYTLGSGPTCGVISVTTGFDMPINLGLSASASGGALTLNLVQANSAAPTANNPVLVPFRSTTATLGTVNWRTITSTLSLVVPSGATLGTSSSNVPFRVWIFLEDNGGTPELAAATCSNVTSIFPCAAWEHTLKTTTTISAGSSTAGVPYATAGVSLDAIRIVGFCDYGSGLGTAGTWASACTTLQVFGPGMKKPGDVVQTVAPSFGTVATVACGATATPGTTSNITAGITLQGGAMNLVRYSAASSANNASGGGNAVFVQMFRGSTAIGFLSHTATGTLNNASNFSFAGFDAPSSSSAQTYVLKCGVTGGTTGTIPAVNTDSATEVLEEVMGALEPANDNGLPFAMAG